MNLKSILKSSWLGSSFSLVIYMLSDEPPHSWIEKIVWSVLSMSSLGYLIWNYEEYKHFKKKGKRSER